MAPAGLSIFPGLGFHMAGHIGRMMDVVRRGHMPSPILECHTHIPLGLGTQTLFAADLCLGSLCGQPHVFWPPFQNSSSEKSALGTRDLTAVPSQEHGGFVSLIAWWLSGLSRWLDCCLLFLRLINLGGRALVCLFPASVPQGWGIHECF